jgi:hypothetical protein
MRSLLDLTTQRITRLLAGSVLVIGVSGGTLFLAAGSAGAAATCDPATFSPGCTMTGSADITGGSLGMAAPASQGWSTTLNGADKQLVDTADASFTVQDATGSGAGWTVTGSATQFTSTAPNVLSNTGTLVYAGSTTSETSGATPGNACAPATSCTVPATTGLTLPVNFTTDGSTVYNLYDANVNTGMGNIVIGTLSAGNPAAWWLNVPASAKADTYTSTITLAISSAPPA